MVFTKIRWYNLDMTVKLNKNKIKDIIIMLLIFCLAIISSFIYIEWKNRVADESQKLSKTQEVKKEINNELPDTQKILQMINNERAKNNTEPLKPEQKLYYSAQLKADNMVIDDYYGHDNPKTGKSGYEYVYEIFPNECIYAGENIDEVKNPGLNEEAFNDWMGSDSHKEAMLDSKYTLTGMAFSKSRTVDGADYYYIVQHFCEVK